MANKGKYYWRCEEGIIVLKQTVQFVQGGEFI
jgi:hypothetical protein